MLFMTWDEGLAITAAAWARNCLFVHNVHLEDVRRVHPTFSSVGENLWAGSPASHFNVTTAIKSWVDEVHKYDFDQNRCSGVCGHYTQVVWASSYKVGCAVQLCPNGVERTSFASREGAIFVCNYATRWLLVTEELFRLHLLGVCRWPVYYYHTHIMNIIIIQPIMF
ncbi:glioma pathogenesis-related protein 1-like isoform X1 [Trematomus bernacchii]|uniref:glioma pathogenesis-related protein 1-like isoform X1 n=1 Tax=Trematomus bernacchii TaxID=40690 RepID=UPI00146C94A6|nr:glioma pathogenesis-related protein 1-like isoform X1 [Trematomus bernacchii]